MKFQYVHPRQNIFASTGDSKESFEVRYEDENIWLTQKKMAVLYDVGLATINEHIKKIYTDNELTEEATFRNFRIVQTEGSRQVSRSTKHYNLQMIIAVGFKVSNETFAENSWYFRNALVRANYNNWQNGIHATTEFLELFFENLLLNSGHELKNRYMHIDFQNEREVENGRCL